MAFVNILLGADKEELSPDLMRHRPEAPDGIMEYLFTQLMRWGKGEGYRWFSLGMAPLAGLEARPLAPRWNRLASLVFRHAEHFYNFRGLRQFKEQFDPAWEPKYLASSSALALPRILANIAALTSRDLKGVVAK
jgi:phosphatidylglycerol lysyltransferase